jgi:hypothetical protein
VHARHRLDLRLIDVGRALAALVVAGSRERCEQALLDVVSAEADGLATVSVRAAWDLLLTTSGWPAGSEVLVSAQTSVRVLDEISTLDHL